MKKLTTLILTLMGLSLSHIATAQDNDSLQAISTVQKDYRIDVLGKKMAEYNTKQSVTKVGGYVNGYRLMVVNTNDRTYAMQVRTYLLQRYPDQQVHMTFVNPYIKLKFGDFVERSEAEKTRNELVKSNKIKGNIYIVPEQVLVKKMKEDSEETN